MMRALIKVALGLFGIYVLIGLTFDALVGYLQPQSEATLVIQTQNAEGQWIDTVLTTRDETQNTPSTADDELWVESGHWFRDWYRRLERNPKVYVIRGDKSRRAYTAVPVNTPEAVERMTVLMGKGAGAGYWIGRTLLLYAPIKPVRLDPGH